MQIEYQGKLIEVTEIEVLTENEKWNEYQLADGKILSIKTILLSVTKAKSEITQGGSPLYLTKTQQVVKVK